MCIFKGVLCVGQWYQKPYGLCNSVLFQNCLHSLLTFYFTVIHIYYLPSVLHTHENILICLIKYSNINHSQFCIGIIDA
jgi:hypothetical protein